MKIINEVDAKFFNLKYGSVFRYKGNVFIKVDAHRWETNDFAINLNNHGLLVIFDRNTIVTPCDAKLILKSNKKH